ncbi:TIR domain-containing protein, partial [Phormidesmis sp. 146-12]
MSDVFISYSRKDKVFVERLHEALLADQRETWVDWQDIPLTADWWHEIERGIEGTNTFVFVISPDSIASSICRDEIDHAVKHNKRVVPIVRRDGFEMAKMHPVLKKHNWLPFRETDEFDRGFRDLVGAIEMDLGYVRSHTRLTERAVEWEDKQRNESFLLRGTDLEDAEQWLTQGASKQPQPTELQGEYIGASRRAETARQRAEAKKQRVFVAIVGGLAIAATGTAVFAFQQQQVANDQKKEAIAQKKEAQNQSERAEQEKQNAQTEKGNAVKSLKLAETAQKLAERRSQEAKAALARAETARKNESQQRQLAQQRQQQAEVAQKSEAEQKARALASKELADQKTVEAKQQRDNAETQTQKALVATALAERGRKNAELNAQSLTALNFSASNLTLEALAEGLKAGHKLKQWEKDLDGEAPMRVKAALQQVVYRINERNRLEGHSDAVRSVSFSPDGQTVVSGSHDGTVKLWDRQGRELQTLKGHSSSVLSVSFSPDGQTIASGSHDGTVKLWDRQGRELQTLKGHSSYVNSV